MEELPKLTLILGGANSGKTAFAEKLAKATGENVTYVATAQALDKEMAMKIEAHRVVRKGYGWETIETPLDLTPAVECTGIVLFDCLTMWITNHMGAKIRMGGLAQEFRNFADACPAKIIAVSNEVGLGIVPDNTAARTFRMAQGQLNQDIAAMADRVIFVAAGLPVVFKGEAN